MSSISDNQVSQDIHADVENLNSKESADLIQAKFPNLESVCRWMRGRGFETNSRAFEELSSILGENIKIRYEIISRGDDAETDATGGSTATRFAHLDGCKIGRVILTSNRLGANFSRQLTRECNGVILEFSTWKVVAIPTGMIKPKFKIANVIKNLNKYVVKPIYDGTTICLYWYEATEKWCLGTTNGYDVSNLKWMGSLTYFEAFTEITKLYSRFSMDSLDKSRCYIIGFRHWSFHPLLTDVQQAWHIATYDIAAINSHGCRVQPLIVNIGIPKQSTTIDTSTASPRKKIAWMQEKNKNALAVYINSLRAVEQGRATHPIIHYGFILTNSTMGAESNIMMESSLLATIRSTVYNIPSTGYCKALGVHAENKLEFIILRAYLGYNTQIKFINLFPQFAPIYNNLNAIFSCIGDCIIGKMRNRTNTLARSFSQELNSAINKVVDALMESEISKISINPLDLNGLNIVLDIIVDKKFLGLYFTHLMNVQHLTN